MEAGKLHVKIGVDVSELKSGLAAAKIGLSQFGSEVKAIGAQVVATTKAALNTVGEFAKNMASKVATTVKAMLSELKSGMQEWGSDMQSTGSTLTTAVSAPLALAGGWAIKLAGNLEATALSFKVLTKDAAAALSIQKQLNDYADKSPFESDDVTLAGKRMVAYKFAIRDVMPYLKDAGDLAAAFADQGVKVADIAGVFGRLKSGDFGEAFARLRDFGIDRKQLEGEGLKFDKSGSYQGSVQDALSAVRKIIQTNYGGMADALGTTLPGMLATASDSISRFATEIGAEIVKAFDVKGLLADFASFLNETKAAFMALSPEAKKAALAVAGLAIALPPLMAALGALVTTILPAIAAGFAAIASPITAVGLAVGGLIFYWDTFNAIMDKTIARLYQLKGALLTAMGLGDWAADAFQKGASWWQAGKSRDAAIAEPQKRAREEAEKQASLARVAARRATRFGQGEGLATNYGSKSNADLAGMESAAKKATKALIELSDARIKAGLDAIKYRDTGGHSIANVVSTVGMMAPKRDFKIDKAGALPDMSNAINLDALNEQFREGAAALKESIKQAGIAEALEDMNGQIQSVLQQGAVDIFSGFGEMLGSMAMGTAGAESIGTMLLSTFGGIVMQLGKMAIGIGVGMLGIKAALQSLNPVVAIGAGVALVAMGAMFKAATSNMSGKIGGGGGKIPKFAGGYGGAYKPTMMMFGDHPNASSNNPEYVLTQDQVKSMLNRAADNAGSGGNGGFIAETRLKGSDILLAVRRAENNSIN